jgi:hypothetical protein
MRMGQGRGVKWKKLYLVQFDEGCSLTMLNVMQVATHDHIAMEMSHNRHCTMGMNPPVFIQ